LKFTAQSIPEVILVEPDRFGDQRGFFMETWNQQRYAEGGIQPQFVQSNVSRSAQGVLRGLHFQNPNPQGKLVWVLEGEVFDVAVDIRHRSPTFGQWVGVYLSAENAQQLYVPEGFAHGFCVTSKHALFCYLCTRVYDAQADAGIHWNDPDIDINWPISKPELSAKDQNAPNLSELDSDKLPQLSS